MVISPWHIYFISILDRVGTGLTVATILLGIALILNIMFPIIEMLDSEDAVPFRKRATKLCVAFVFCFIGAAITPTTKEMCAIIVIPKIANNQELQGLGSDIIELSREWINSLKPQQEVVK